MKITKWLAQGLGVGAGILAARIFYPPTPRLRKVKRWMFTDHDKVYEAPWSGDNDAIRSRNRSRKVVDHLDEIGSRDWGTTK